MTIKFSVLVLKEYLVTGFQKQVAKASLSMTRLALPIEDRDQSYLFHCVREGKRTLFQNQEGELQSCVSLRLCISLSV